MKDITLSHRGKAAFAALCGICCGVPMLVIFGAVSLGVVAVSGVSIVSIIALGVLGIVVVRRHSHRPADDHPRAEHEPCAGVEPNRRTQQSSLSGPPDPARSAP